MYLISRNNNLLFRDEDYNKILEYLARVKEIDVYDLNTFIKYENELKNEIKSIIKEKNGIEIKVMNTNSNSEYFRTIENDVYEVD